MIVDLFYNLARQHNRVRAFFYNSDAKKGYGNEAHPLVWLDDPIYGVTISGTNSVPNVLRYTINFDILDIPEDEIGVKRVQDECFIIGLDMIEKIRKDSRKSRTSFSFVSFSFITLRNYYDNNAAGVRFTLYLDHVNPANLCANDFDPSKEFDENDPLYKFDVSGAQGCAVFMDKYGLPVINVKDE